MGDWINRFMEGKKKYSFGWVLPVAVAVINTLVADPQMAQTLTGLVQEYVPTLVSFAGGIAYLIMEGLRDIKRSAASTTSLAPPGAIATAQPPLPEQAPLAPLQPQPEAEPFNPTAFAADLDDRAKRNYLEVTPIARYFAARDKGMVTPCTDIRQAVDYAGFLLDLAHQAFTYKFGFPYREAEQHLADDPKCPYYSVDNMARQKGLDYWEMLRELRDIMVNYADVCKLQDWRVDFKKLLPPHFQTLYHVVYLASSMLESAQRS